MAKISFEEATRIENSKEQYSGDGVGFFKLADGESKIVRILAKNVNDFEVFSTHNIKLNSGGWRTVNCIGDGCPICARKAKGEGRKNSFVVKMIEYGEEPKPVVWLRNFSFASEYKQYIDTYGPLDAFCSRVSRVGQKLDTKYFTAPNLPATTFSTEAYPIPEGAFEGYNPLGRIVLNKTKEELQHYVDTGDFPPKEGSAPTTTASPYTPTTNSAPPISDDIPF